MRAREEIERIKYFWICAKKIFAIIIIFGFTHVLSNELLWHLINRKLFRCSSGAHFIEFDLKKIYMRLPLEML